jgi:CRP/FNR family transcriptional regulator, cyclic AMP receptor protein
MKFSVVNARVKEAIGAIFGPGDFFGEGVMAGQTLRMGTATAISPTTVLMIEKDEMLRALHAEHELSDRLRVRQRLSCWLEAETAHRSCPRKWKAL